MTTMFPSIHRCTTHTAHRPVQLHKPMTTLTTIKQAQNGNNTTQENSRERCTPHHTARYLGIQVNCHFTRHQHNTFSSLNPIHPPIHPSGPAKDHPSIHPSIRPSVRPSVQQTSNIRRHFNQTRAPKHASIQKKHI